MSILSIIVKSYLSIFLVIGGVALLLFGLGIHQIFRFTKRPNDGGLARDNSRDRSPSSASADLTISTPSGIRAIAGDNLLSTQLDLARAYIDSGKNPLAKTILETVVEEGDSVHQEEAQRLLSTL